MKKQNITAAPLLYSFDAGNGAVKGISTEIEARGPIQFEPLIAPITDRRGVNSAEEKPTYSLRDGDENIFVFGIDDVYTHGRRTAARRLNAMSRYSSDDYFKLLDVLYLNCFSGWRGHNEYITPTGIVSLPISEFNDPEVGDGIKSRLCKKRVLTDYDGCELRIDIAPNKLLIMPESFGALMHYQYDHKLLTKRADSEIAGTTLVVDIGYETTDCSLFAGAKYQRDQSMTVSRAGMGIVARTIAEWSRVKGADASIVDRSMRALAGCPASAAKMIEVAPGQAIDVASIYAQALDELAQKIVQAVETAYPEAPSRMLLAGGGAYHLTDAIADIAAAPVVVAPDPDVANVWGSFTWLKLKSVNG